MVKNRFTMPALLLVLLAVGLLLLLSGCYRPSEPDLVWGSGW